MIYKEHTIYLKNNFSILNKEQLSSLLETNRPLESKDIPLCSNCYQKTLEEMRTNITMFLNSIKKYIKDNPIQIEQIKKIDITINQFCIIQLENNSSIKLDNNGNII